jgi:hypothetical protein
VTLIIDRKLLFRIGCCFAISAIASAPRPVLAWGDLGHEVIARIADHYLEPAVRSRFATILAGDRSRLTTGKDIEAEATWADRYRDSDRNTTRVHYNQTRNWHFVDLEIDGPDLRTACFGEPPPPKKAASAGPAADCIVDKLDELIAELGTRGTSKKERLLALQFLLHFIGDVHQPLHASDDHDEGGNLKIVAGPGLPSGNLHADWDVAFVEKLGSDEAQIAQRLLQKISPSQRLAWSSGKPSEWAMESFDIARQHAYGSLPAASSAGHYELSAAYINDAAVVAGEQLSKAGVRLAYVLNQSLH